MGHFFFPAWFLARSLVVVGLVSLFAMFASYLIEGGRIGLLGSFKKSRRVALTYLGILAGSLAVVMAYCITIGLPQRLTFSKVLLLPLISGPILGLLFILLFIEDKKQRSEKSHKFFATIGICAFAIALFFAFRPSPFLVDGKDAIDYTPATEGGTVSEREVALAVVKMSISTLKSSRMISGEEAEYSKWSVFSEHKAGTWMMHAKSWLPFEVIECNSEIGPEGKILTPLQCKRRSTI